MTDQILQVYDSNQKVYWPVRLKDNGDGTYALGQTVSVAADIELGAVELKDASADTRGSVAAANTARTTATIVLAVQHVDAAGNPAIFPVALGAQGGLKVEGVASGTTIPVTADTELPAAAALADAVANPTTPTAGSAFMVFNGATWDRARNNGEAIVFASAARTATENSTDQTNYNARGIRAHLNITAASGTTPTLDIKLQALVNGVYIDMTGAAFAQKTTTGTDSLVIYPGIAVVANRSTSDVLPRVWRAVATIAGTTPSFTFSLGVSYIN